MTFHAFMLNDAKSTAQDHLLEGQTRPGTHHAAIADEIALIRHADALGMHRCWMREHHFTDYGFLPNTMTMAAHVAALTDQVQLGTAVITLPLHHPIRVAEEVALVDMLSGGRVSVGLGRGYQSVEFDAFGVSLDDARARTDEAIQVMRRLWTEPTVTHHGTHWQFESVRLQPRPVQKPHPPMYYASINAASVEHYGRQGIPFIVDSTMRTSALAELVELWRNAARSAGHDPTGADLVAVRYIWLDDTDDAAREYVARSPRVTSLATEASIRPVRRDGTVAAGYEYWEKGWHGRDLDHYNNAEDWDDRWVAGTPDRVISQLKHLESIGIRDVCCVFGLEAAPPPRHEIERRMSRFAREILPAFA